MERPLTPYIVASSGLVSAGPIAVRIVLVPVGSKVRLLDGGALGEPKLEIQFGTAPIGQQRAVTFEPDLLPFLTDCYLELTDPDGVWDGAPAMVFTG
jgi:hypothetical protein